MRFTLVVLVVSLLAAPAFAQELDTCPEYEGITCDGWVTDAAGVLDAEPSVEAAAARFVTEHGNEIAVVLVATTGAIDPQTFAADLGNTWGVGDRDRDDGIVVLVALAERRTEIVTGPGLSLDRVDDLAAAGNGFFADGDFDGGVIAIVTSIGLSISGERDRATQPTATEDDSSDDEEGISLGGIAVAVGVALVGWTLMGNAQRSTRAAISARRSRQVDDALERLDTSGSEFPLLDEYAIAPSAGFPDTSVTAAASTLMAILDDRAAIDEDALRALWRSGAVLSIDRERLVADAEVPLELRVSQERRMLDDAVQATAREALEVPLKEPERFDTRLAELDRLIEALRPHRIASARRRSAAALADSLTNTPLGWIGVTDLGRRFLESAPALGDDELLAPALIEIDAAYATAAAKTARLEDVYKVLPASTARPAVAAALADLDDDPAAAVSAYQRLRSRLLRTDKDLVADGLEPSAIAALLLINRDEGNVDAFIDNYRERRSAGMDPAEAVEYALAGLRDPDELKRVRKASRAMSLPVSITAALLRRREDGEAVFRQLLDEISEFDVDEADTRRTIAGVLAISLEPSQAVRRWGEARAALEALGLKGTYADVAAAFGASDNRGPRAFALSYAAQRQALARSEIDDADRFAPELAHEGTSRQTDSWSGDPIPADYGSFDPFTFFYYHWVITRGAGGSFGWEPVYRDRSWSTDRGSWWGGGGGFGGSGSSWGGSSWGSSGGGTSFGGFGGGGFGGGSSGGSGW